MKVMASTMTFFFALEMASGSGRIGFPPLQQRVHIFRVTLPHHFLADFVAVNSTDLFCLEICAF